MITLHSGCKINLGLRITGQRPDGYHELDSVFLPLPFPRDDLHLHHMTEPLCQVTCTREDIDPDSNTLTKAYKVFCEHGGKPVSGLHIALTKRIPSGAGLGGGSGNAAALLRWLNTTSPQPLSETELAAAALRVGADVPFFLQDAACHVHGIGECLEPVRLSLKGWHLLLVCPEVHVSTPWAFKQFDSKKHIGEIQKNSTNDLTEDSLFLYNSFRTAREQNARHYQDLPDLHNDLEEIVFAIHPQLQPLKTTLETAGARTAMSGSGSSIYGLFRPETEQKVIDFCASLMRKNVSRVYKLSL